MFIFFTEKCSFSLLRMSNQQLVSKMGMPILTITNIFDEGLDVCSVSFDISKTFDKVWHDDIIFKLKRNVIFKK